MIFSRSIATSSTSLYGTCRHFVKCFRNNPWGRLNIERLLVNDQDWPITVPVWLNSNKCTYEEGFFYSTANIRLVLTKNNNVIQIRSCVTVKKILFIKTLNLQDKLLVFLCLLSERMAIYHRSRQRRIFYLALSDLVPNSVFLWKTAVILIDEI